MIQFVLHSLQYICIIVRLNQIKKKKDRYALISFSDIVHGL